MLAVVCVYAHFWLSARCSRAEAGWAESINAALSRRTVMHLHPGLGFTLKLLEKKLEIPITAR